MTIRSVFVATLLTAIAIGSASAAHTKAQSDNQSSVAPPQRRTAVVFRFAVETQPVTDAAALSAKACPETDGIASSDTAASIAVDPKILNNISEEMGKRLSKKMSVMVNPEPNAIPVGALVISGCITRANAGNAAARLVGMNVGASHLGVHIVALSRTNDGWAPMDTFDVKVIRWRPFATTRANRTCSSCCQRYSSRSLHRSQKTCGPSREKAGQGHESSRTDRTKWLTVE